MLKLAIANIFGNLAAYSLPKILTSLPKTNTSSNRVAFSKPATTTTSVNVGYVDPTATTTGTNITAPVLDTSTPTVEYPSFEEAYAKAKSVYEPKYESAVLSQNQLTRDQLKSLKQGLSAKGYSDLRGGQRIVGEQDITQDQAAVLENLRNQYDSYIGQYANDLYNNESSTATQRLNTLLADRDATNAAALDLYRTNLGAAQQKEANDINKYNSIFEWLYGIFGGEE